MVRCRCFGLVAGSCLAFGCGGNGDPGGPTTILVEGTVISARSRSGIEGAEVNIGNILGTKFVTTTTGSDGSFAANAEYFDCAGVNIFVRHTGYLQLTPFPNLCPGASHTIELQPHAVTSLITPQDPTIGFGGTVDLQLRVTYYDGTVEDAGEAVWSVAPSGTIDGPECGTVPDAGIVRATTYTAPSSLPPAQCGPAEGRVAVGAGAVVVGTVDVGDTVVVTVTP